LVENREVPVEFRFQHVHPPQKSTIELLSDGGLIVRLEEPMRALTSGQYAVLYSGDVCLGSAQIVNNGPSMYEQDVRQHIHPGIYT
jgi:tRNA-specific 2-thiouridylase